MGLEGLAGGFFGGPGGRGWKVELREGSWGVEPRLRRKRDAGKIRTKCYACKGAEDGLGGKVAGVEVGGGEG